MTINNTFDCFKCQIKKKKQLSKNNIRFSKYFSRVFTLESTASWQTMQPVDNVSLFRWECGRQKYLFIRTHHRYSYNFVIMKFPSFIIFFFLFSYFSRFVIPAGRLFIANSSKRRWKQQTFYIKEQQERFWVLYRIHTRVVPT